MHALVSKFRNISELTKKVNGYNIISLSYVNTIPLVDSTALCTLFQYLSPFSSPHLLINSFFDEIKNYKIEIIFQFKENFNME